MNRHHLLTRLIKILDLAIMVLCFTLSVVLILPGFDAATIRDFMQLRISFGNVFLFGTFVAIWHMLFSGFGLYEKSVLNFSFRNAIDVLKATLVGTSTIVAIAVLFDISVVDTRFILSFLAGTSFLSVSVRFLAKKLLVRHNMQVENLSRILIVGVNARSLSLAKRIETEPELGCRVIGFVDNTIQHAQDFETYGYDLVAEYDDLSSFLGSTELEEVLVCLPLKSRFDDVSSIVAICENQGIAVGILRDMSSRNLTTSNVRQIGGQTIVTVRPHAIIGGQAAIKRALDVLISSILIVLFLPVFGITALIIKLTSPGPVSFSQQRVGLNKKQFRMLKFRTMVVEAEEQQASLEYLNEAAGPAFKIRSDPRITPVGKFLRKFSIDELPQFINVIKGEMSLVGPRPLPLRDYAGFSEDWHLRRISVRPGITGLWQINGRDHSSFDEWMKLDIEYIDRWSLMLDFRVILMTVSAVLKGSGN